MNASGNSKLLFTCPHNGLGELDELSLRCEDHLPYTCKKDPGQKFSNDNDVYTHQLTDSIVNNILGLSGIKPYEHVAELHRKYVDYNRRYECAFEPYIIQARQKYLDYHIGILQKIDEMLPENENGLAFLFDIHGTGREEIEIGDQVYPFEVLIGTDQQCSIRALTQIDPKVWWDDDKGLIPLLQRKGRKVFPPNKDLEEQNHLLDGGYAIQTYGNKKRLAAIQIEVIYPIRKDTTRREELAEDIADCICQFVKPFI
ncbi:MAG TPA: hypothetical protein VH796_13205 [Nitrososphaeraceae archaeon]